MNKFLLSLIACMFAITGFAQQTGDYAYTANGRVKILSDENLISNGDFSDATNGWMTDQDMTLNPDTFSVQTEIGPDGGTALITLAKSDGPSSPSSLVRKIQVQAGNTYYISYQVMTAEDFTSTVTYGDKKNYQNVFFNLDGTLLDADGNLNVITNIAKTVTTTALNWQKVEYSFTAQADGYVVIYIYAPYTGQAFADFKMMLAKSVPDDREVNKKIAELQSYIDNPLFPNAHEDMQDMIEQLQELLAADNADQIDELMPVIDNELIPAFLDGNTVDISSRLSNPGFDGLTPGASCGTAGVGTGNIGGSAWNLTWDAAGSSKSRWSIKAASTYPEPTTEYLTRGITYGYTLVESSIMQTVNLPAGKYMFTMKLNASKYSSKNSTARNPVTLDGAYVVMGKDSVLCSDPDTLNMKRYTVYTTLTEPSSVAVGFYMKEQACHLITLDLTELRAIDNTAEDIEKYDNSIKFADAKKALADKIAEAQTYLASTDYIYNKVSLTDSIAKSQSIYDKFTDYEYLDSINNQTKRLTRAITYYKSQNAQYTALAASIADGNAAVDDASLTGDKTALKAVVADAVAYYNARTAEDENDSTTFAGVCSQMTDYSTAIAEAITALKASALSNDEMYNFFSWSAEGADFNPELEADDYTTSSAATGIKLAKGTFAGNSLGDRFAFNSAATISCVQGSGLYTTVGKNKVVMSVVGLKNGDKVTVDWNCSGSLYAVSNNASYTTADGSTVTLVSGNKVAGNIIPADNTDGLNGYCRTVFTMNIPDTTGDEGEAIAGEGTLDFYIGSSNCKLYFGYVGIDYMATDISEVHDSRLMTHDSTYNLAGQRVAGDYKGIVIRDGKKYLNK